MMGTLAMYEPETIMRLDVPSGYRVVSKNDRNIIFKKGYEETFKGFAVPDAVSPDNSRKSHHGRAPLITMPLSPETGDRAVVRKCIRGGILGRIIKEMYVNCGNPRPLA